MQNQVLATNESIGLGGAHYRISQENILPMEHAGGSMVKCDNMSVLVKNICRQPLQSPGTAHGMWLAIHLLSPLVYLFRNPCSFPYTQVSQLSLACVTSSIRLFRHFGHLNSLFVYV